MIYIRLLKIQQQYLYIFADDTNLFKSGTDINAMERDINDELRNISVCIKVNKLSLNVDEMYICLFNCGYINMPCPAPALQCTTLCKTEFQFVIALRWRHNDARKRLKSPASRLFTQSFIQMQIKENIKAPRHWPLCGEFTVDRWIPRTNGQLRG